MTRRLAGDENAQRLFASVHRLVLLAGRDLDAFVSADDEFVMFDLHRQLAFEDIEELPGAVVMMTCLAGAGRHELLNDVELRRANEVPAVAVVVVRAAPFVVFGVGGGDDFGWHLREM